MSFSQANIQAGDILAGRYKIVRELGRGGMGIVLEVENVLVQKNFALKVVDLQVASPDAVRRFQREAKLLIELDHPNIVRALDCGVMEEGTPYVLMEFLDGMTLAEHLKSNGPLSVRQFNDVFIPILEALSFAHERGVIHRDLKPGNIMLMGGANGITTPKLVDFGIAAWTERATETFTRTGEILGTPLYISPEQTCGEAVTARSDLYSLGCVMFEALAGTPPFTGRSVLETLMMHKEQAAPTLKEASLGGKYPDYLEATVKKLLAKNPEDRFATANAVRQALQEMSAAESPRARQADSTTTSGQPGLASARMKQVVVSACVAVVSAVVCSVYFAGKQQGTRPPDGQTSSSKTLTNPGELESNQESKGGTLNTPPDNIHNQDTFPFSLTKEAGNVIIPFQKTNARIGKILWYDKVAHSYRTDQPVTIPDNVKYWLQPMLSDPLIGDELSRFRDVGLYGVIFHVTKNEGMFVEPDTMTKAIKLVPDSIKGLMFDETHITAADAKALSQLNDIEWFGLKDSVFEKDVESKIADIVVTKNLHTLVLNPRQATALAKPFLTRLAKAPGGLTELSVTHCGIDRSDCENISKLVSLKYLNIKDALSKVDRVAAFHLVSKLPEVHTMCINGPDVPPAAMLSIISMKSLKRLIVSNKLPASVEQAVRKCHILIVPTDGPDAGFEPWRAPTVDQQWTDK